MQKGYVDLEAQEYLCETCINILFQESEIQSERFASMDFQETDTPCHCCECEELIDHNLTTDGLEYVKERLQDPLTETTTQWQETWSHCI